MPTYSYVAINSAGSTVKGKITAANELDFEERLGLLNLVVLKSKVEGSNSGFFRRGKISNKDLIMLCVHFEQLDRAGVPLLDALADIRDSADSSKLRDVMADVYESVKGGELLSEAMAKRPDAFNEVFVGLVAAGEKTGSMSEAFAHLIEHLKWSNDLRRSIKAAIRYPIALVVVMVSVIALMMIFVVPKLINFLTSQGFSLPIHTRALIATSNFFVNYWYLVIGLPIITFMVVSFLYRTSAIARSRIDRFLLNTPFIGQTVLKINLARFVHFFAVTFNSGIGVLDCLDTARKVIGNVVIKDTITQIMQRVSEGSSITRSISSTQKFPNLVVRMFKVGEDSGNMGEALENVRFFYDREVKDSVAAMVAILQPAITIVMGVMLFWVIAAIFGPLYSNFSKMEF